MMPLITPNGEIIHAQRGTPGFLQELESSLPLLSFRGSSTRWLNTINNYHITYNIYI